MELWRESLPTNRLLCLSPYVADGPRKLALERPVWDYPFTLANQE